MDKHTNALADMLVYADKEKISDDMKLLVCEFIRFVQETVGDTDFKNTSMRDAVCLYENYICAKRKDMEHRTLIRSSLQFIAKYIGCDEEINQNQLNVFMTQCSVRCGLVIPAVDVTHEKLSHYTNRPEIQDIAILLIKSNRLKLLPKCLVSHLIEFLEQKDLTTVDDIIEMDCEDIERIQIWYVRRFIKCAKFQPIFDPQQRYTSFLQYAPQKFFCEFPCLWKYPPLMLTTLYRRMTCYEDRQALLDLSEGLAQHRLEGTLQRRIPARVYSSVTKQLCSFVSNLRSMITHTGQTFSLNAVFGNRNEWHAHDLLDLLARVVAFSFRHPITKKPTIKTESASNNAVRLRILINSLVSAGLFRLIHVDYRINIAKLHRRVAELHNENPQLYSDSPPERKYRNEARVTDELIEKMRAACHTAREKAMLMLLAMTGLRAQAICLLRWKDVWDFDTNKPTESLRVVEKFSNVRMIPALPSVQEALQNLRKEVARSDAAAFVFYIQKKPLQTGGSVSKTI